MNEISLSVKGEHTLILKQALLSSEVPENQVNVVEVETAGYKGNIKLPIITLVGGKQSHVLLDLNFPDPPVTLRLIQGEGPIHISGNHVINAEQYNDDDDDDDDDDLGKFFSLIKAHVLGSLVI
ncbi:UNVERIFIED_CONTAM: hypothetical protein PYX00_007913 [Menopon gallinae]|uniref:Nucleoplasmin core domain-containing protein n=1 Tax=Menopon gallinae TaxID=328185 RepID=A0AAW2HL87_9NEOP